MNEGEVLITVGAAAFTPKPLLEERALLALHPGADHGHEEDELLLDQLPLSYTLHWEDESLLGTNLAP